MHPVHARPPLAILVACLVLLVVVPCAHALTFAEESGSPVGVGANPVAIAAGDVNGDGGPDLVVADGTSSDVYVLLRQVNGGFAQEGLPISTGAGSGPSDIAIGDFNADGRNDFAVSNFVGGDVRVFLRNPGNTGFTQEGAGYAALNAGAVALGDFDGDGRLDFVVARYNSSDVLTYLRNGANTGFTLEGGTPVQSNPRSLAVGDWDGDNRTDFAVTNVGSGSVSVMLRNGTNNGFTNDADSPILVSGDPQTIRAADFDGNGRPDIAFASSGTNVATVLLRGAGFAADLGSPFGVGSAPVGVAPGDLDNDGVPDLAVANQGDGSVSVFRRVSATGGFTQDPGTAIAAGSAATALAVADFDSDGRRDIAVANQGANTVSVFRNTTPAPDLGTVTAPPPAPGVAPDPVTGRLAAPSAGKSVNADPVSGKVLVKVPGSKRFVSLAGQERQIPIKSIVDARAGKVEIETAAGTSVKPLQQAVFYDGVFQLLQDRVKKDAIVEARLVGALENCPKSKKSAVAAKVRGRRLWGKGKGRFRTRGKRSSTTVRGTTWLVEDRCDDTTLNRVTQGTVVVRDFRLKKDFTVKAPGSYVARPKPRRG
jgi:FG-GAP-like repeat